MLDSECIPNIAGLIFDLVLPLTNMNVVRSTIGPTRCKAACCSGGTISVI